MIELKPEKQNHSSGLIEKYNDEETLTENMFEIRFFHKFIGLEYILQYCVDKFNGIVLTKKWKWTKCGQFHITCVLIVSISIQFHSQFTTINKIFFYQIRYVELKNVRQII